MQHFDNNSISTHFALGTLKSAARMGVDIGSLLKDSNLDGRLLGNQKFRLTPAQFGSLARLSWERGDDEFMACAERPARYGTFSLFAREAVRAENLLEVYKHLCRFYRLVNESLSLNLSIEGEKATLEMSLSKPELDPDFLLRDFLLLLWHRFPSWLIGRRIHLFEAQMTGPKPEHADEYRLIFPCPVSYEASANRLIFDVEALKAPIIQNLETLRDHLRSAPLQWFTRQEYLPVFTRRVRDIMGHMEFVEIDMESVAHQLNMTVRTLRRKLDDEGTGFQDIKDELRRDSALHLLNQSSLSIQRISQQLGFSETAAFTRSFKKWTGQTPRAFRTGQF